MIPQHMAKQVFRRIGTGGENRETACLARVQACMALPVVRGFGQLLWQEGGSLERLNMLWWTSGRSANWVRFQALGSHPPFDTPPPPGQCWAMYCLIWLYITMHDELEQTRPLLKFICVKAVVFFSFWQSVSRRRPPAPCSSPAPCYSVPPSALRPRAYLPSCCLRSSSVSSLPEAGIL